jgi:hypothetical protein
MLGISSFIFILIIFCTKLSLNPIIIFTIIIIYAIPTNYSKILEILNIEKKVTTSGNI